MVMDVVTCDTQGETAQCTFASRISPEGWISGFLTVYHYIRKSENKAAKRRVPHLLCVWSNDRPLAEPLLSLSWSNDKCFDNMRSAGKQYHTYSRDPKPMYTPRVPKGFSEVRVSDTGTGSWPLQ